MSDLPGYVSGHACTHTCTHFYINEIMRYTLLHILLFKFIIHIFYILSYSKSCIAFHNLDRPSLLYISFLLVGIWIVFCLFFFFFPIVNNDMVIIFTIYFCVPEPVCAWDYFPINGMASLKGIYILYFIRSTKCVLVNQSRLTLCNLMDCSPPGSSVHGIL